MASLKKRGDVWTARFRVVENGVETNKRLSGFATKKEAERAVAEYEKEPPTPDMTLGTAVNSYLSYLKTNAKRSSYYTVLRQVRTQIFSYFNENTPLTKVTPARIQMWQNNLIEQGLSYKYCTTIRSLFISIFKNAKLYGVSANPFEQVRPFKNTKGKKEMLFWTEEEFLQFYSVLPDLENRTLFAWMYLMGTRKGETVALKWTDIDFISKTVKIDKTFSRFGDDFTIKQNLTSPKTLNSIRTITIPDKLLKMLAEYKTPSIFIWSGDSPLSYNALRVRMVKYIKLSGVKHIRVHDLRHSCVSYMVNHSTGNLQILYAIAQRIGDTPDQILKTYGHFFHTNKNDLLETLNNVGI